MILAKRKYDLIWRGAAILSVIAVLLSDSGRFQSTFLMRIALGCALAVAGYLSFFVKRDSTNVEDSVEKAETRTPVPVEKETTVAASEAKIAHTSAAMFYDFVFTRLEDSERSAHELRNYWAHARVEQMIVSNLRAQSLMRDLVLEQQQAKRRNILEEASEMAKKLRGFGKEVIVYSDDSIGLRDCGDEDPSLLDFKIENNPWKPTLPN